MMKKIALALLLVAGIQQLKAQELWSIKPADKLTGDVCHNYFNPPADSSFKQLIDPKLNLQPANVKLTPLSPTVQIVYSRMPVVKLQTNDRMPVVVPGEPDVKYTMLVKKIEVINPGYPVQATNP